MKHFKFSLDSNDAYKFVSNDMRIDQDNISKEIEIFWNKLLFIIHNIMNEFLSKKNKEMMSFYLNNINIPEISIILSEKINVSSQKDLFNYRNFNKKYNKIIEKIKSKLCWSKEFNDLIKKECPQILRNRLMDWIKENRKKFFKNKITCPVCSKKFDNYKKFFHHLHFIKNIKSNCWSKRHNEKYTNMENKHLEFIKNQENLIINEFKKIDKYRDLWAKQLSNRKDVYYNYLSIYNLCRKFIKENQTIRG